VLAGVHQEALGEGRPGERRPSDPGDGPTAGLAGPVSGRLSFRDGYQRLAAIDQVLGPTWRERALELQVLLRVRAMVMLSSWCGLRAAADGLE
jgi:hypothetical protein